MSILNGVKTAVKSSISVTSLLAVGGAVAAKKIADSVNPIFDSQKETIQKAREAEIMLNNLGMGTPNITSKYEDPDCQLSSSLRRMLTSFIETNESGFIITFTNFSFIDEFAKKNHMTISVDPEFIDEDCNLICNPETIITIQKKKGGVVTMNHRYRFTTQCGGTKPIPCFYQIK